MHKHRFAAAWGFGLAFALGASATLAQPAAGGVATRPALAAPAQAMKLDERRPGSDWNAAPVASPTLDFVHDSSPGAAAFQALVPDPQAYLNDIAQRVVKTLYRSAAEVPAFSTLTLRIERWPKEPQGIAWKDGAPPHITVAINAFYLERYAAQGGQVADEVRGILFHEMTHAYQHAEGMAPEAVEGMADLVRHLNGHQPLSLRKPGGHWTSGYKTTAFFFAWLQNERGFPDFAWCFNQSARPGRGVWRWDTTLSACSQGADLPALWAAYQQAIQAPLEIR